MGKPKTKIYAIDARAYVTIYVKETSKRRARLKAREMIGEEITLEEDDLVTGQDFGLDMPDVSLSPAATIHGIDDGEPAEIVWEEGE